MSYILYHCTCTSASTASNVPPEPTLPSATFAFHALHALYFCEECDLVRCNRCVSVEVSGYYCPNCLFEVPSASVRAEKNRCARNCFQCPHCRNTLSVVPSDPPEEVLSQSRPQTTTESIGEPPFFLYCNFCRWDSQEVGIVFEKPTGLALQLQKLEDNLPDSLEFERLKDHFEPLLRSSSSSHHQTQASHHRNPITAAASSALARDVPGLHQPIRGVSGRTYSNPKAPGRANASKGWDDWDSVIYKSRLEVAGSGVGIRIESELDWIKALDEEHGVGRVAEMEQRWLSSWTQSLKASELQPLRIPLHSKKTKRCPDCRHILIKPEQKAQSVRYKIKLMAANYLPSIDVIVPSLVPPPPTGGSQLPKSKIKDVEDSGALTMQPGKSYPFQMTFTNPLYEPIQVRLSVHRAPPRMTSGDAIPHRPPFGITLPSSTFPISAFAEAWEYEDDEDMFDEDDLEQMLSGNPSGGGLGLGADSRGGRLSKSHIGVLERKANVTRVGGEVLIGRDASGEVKFNMQVSYTYRADDSAADTTSPKKTGKEDPAAAGEMKTFTFFTLVSLGSIAPKLDAGSSGSSKRDSTTSAR